MARLEKSGQRQQAIVKKMSQLRAVKVTTTIGEKAQKEFTQ